MQIFFNRFINLFSTSKAGKAEPSKKDAKVSEIGSQALPKAEIREAKPIASHKVEQDQLKSRFHALFMKIHWLSLPKLLVQMFKTPLPPPQQQPSEVEKAAAVQRESKTEQLPKLLIGQEGEDVLKPESKLEKPESIKSPAYTLCQEGKIDEAIQLCEKKGKAGYGEMSSLGDQLMQEGKYDAAIRLFEKSQKFFPVDLVKVADCYCAMKKIEEAEKIEAQIKKSAHLDARMLLALHVLNGENGRVPDATRAESLFKTIVHDYSKKDAARFGPAESDDAKLGNICFRTPETYGSLIKAVKNSFLPAMLWMGCVDARGNTPLKAIELYRKAAGMGSSDAYVLLGDLWRKGDVTGKVRDFDILMARFYYVQAALKGNRLALDALRKSPDLHMKALDEVPPGKEKEPLETELSELKKKGAEAKTNCINELESTIKSFAAKAAAEKLEINKKMRLEELEEKKRLEDPTLSPEALLKAEKDFNAAVEARKTATDELKRAKQQILERGYVRLTPLKEKSPDSWTPKDLSEEIERMKAGFWGIS